MKLYERYAEEIDQRIIAGDLRPGDKLPSVRQASASRRVSPSTVFQAYYLLEARRRIRARPRSGYFVAATAKRRADAPETSRPSAATTEVKESELIFNVLEATRDADIVPLGSAFPSAKLFPLARLSRSLAAGMRELDPARIVLDLSSGNPTLRRQIALRYVADGLAVEMPEIVITNGAMEALNLCLQAVAAPGDVVAIESPTFYAALQALERLQLKAVEVATNPRTGIDLDSLTAVLKRHAVKACWLIPNFQNPLGSLMPEENKRALVLLLAARGIPLIEDDVYSELHHGSPKPALAKAFDRAGLVMHCSSFSKCLAPGYRVGWVAAGKFARHIERLKLMTSLSAAVPSQQALSHYLAHGGYDRHLRALRRTLAAQQVVALDAVERYFPKGTRCSRPEGGYFLWLELPGEVDGLKLHRLALAQNISLAPGHMFSADHRFTHCLRLNFGHADDPRFNDALRTVGRLAASLVGDVPFGTAPAASQRTPM